MASARTYEEPDDLPAIGEALLGARFDLAEIAFSFESVQVLCRLDGIAVIFDIVDSKAPASLSQDTAPLDLIWHTVSGENLSHRWDRGAISRELTGHRLRRATMSSGMLILQFSEHHTLTLSCMQDMATGTLGMFCWLDLE